MMMIKNQTVGLRVPGSCPCRPVRVLSARKQYASVCKSTKVDVPSVSERIFQSMPLPVALSLMSYCDPSFADESVDVINKSSGFLGFTNGGLVIAFSPIAIYSVFYLYRATINPKAKLQDLLFVAAACVVVANIASIVIFKKRIY